MPNYRPADKPEFSQKEAALRAALQMLSMGYSDEAIAQAQTKYQKYLNELPFHILEGGGGSMGGRQPDSFDEKEAYDRNWAEQQRRVKGSARDWPKTDIGVGLGAGVLTALAPIPGSAPAAAGKSAASIAKLYKHLDKLRSSQTAPKILGEGAIIGSGKSEHKISEEPLEVLKDAGTGAVTNLAFQKAFQKGGEGIKKAYRSRKEAKEAAAEDLPWVEAAARRKRAEKYVRIPSKDGPFSNSVDIITGIDKPKHPNIITPLKSQESIDQAQAMADDIMPHGAVLVDDIKESLKQPQVLGEKPKYTNPYFFPGSTGGKNIGYIEGVIDDLDRKFPQGRMTFNELRQYVSEQGDRSGTLKKAADEAGQEAVGFVKKLVDRYKVYKGGRELPLLEDRGQQKLRGEAEDLLEETRKEIEDVGQKTAKLDKKFLDVVIGPGGSEIGKPGKPPHWYKDPETGKMEIDPKFVPRAKDYPDYEPLLDEPGKKWHKRDWSEEDAQQKTLGMKGVPREQRKKLRKAEEMVKRYLDNQRRINLDQSPPKGSNSERAETLKEQITLLEMVIDEHNAYKVWQDKLRKKKFKKDSREQNIEGMEEAKKAYKEKRDLVLDDRLEVHEPASEMFEELDDIIIDLAIMVNKKPRKKGALFVGEKLTTTPSDRDHYFKTVMEVSQEVTDRDASFGYNPLKHYPNLLKDIKDELAKAEGKGLPTNEQRIKSAKELTKYYPAQKEKMPAYTDVGSYQKAETFGGFLKKAANAFSEKKGVGRALGRIKQIADNNPDFVQRYFNNYKEASIRGPAAIVATHKTLMAKDGTYRSYFEETENNGE